MIPVSDVMMQEIGRPEKPLVYKRLRGEVLTSIVSVPGWDFDNRNLKERLTHEFFTQAEKKIATICLGCSSSHLNYEIQKDEASQMVYCRMSIRCKGSICPDEQPYTITKMKPLANGGVADYVQEEIRPLAEDKEMEMILDAAAQKMGADW